MCATAPDKSRFRITAIDRTNLRGATTVADRASKKCANTAVNRTREGRVEKMRDEQIPVHPVQREWRYKHEEAVCPRAVTLRAYEVYAVVHGEQTALVTGNCRGGFGIGELIAYLYAYGFPRNEWRTRVDEALRGMKL